MDIEKLKELIDDDDLGLLDVKPKQGAAMTEDERLSESFFEINDFYRNHEREPENDLANMQEAKLAMRLSGLRKDPVKMEVLADLDEFNLLQPQKKIESIDDILADDDLDLLGGGDNDSIFKLRHVPQTIDMPEHVASRKPCKQFDEFEPLFLQCHADLKSGKRKLLPFANEQQIQKGQFFVLKGVVAYVADVGKKEKKGGKVNARLHCIFENGTESDMLLRSLARELYKDGRRITDHEDRLMDELNDLSSDDEKTGHIYVLKSLSTDPQLQAIDDLYKIGFCAGAVEDRIRNAENEATYLMAKVHLLRTFECYNLNPQKLESLLHTFFGQSCLNVDVFDKNGKRCTPREWFIAPLEVIEEAISLIISGEIVKYRYEPDAKIICYR